MKKCIVLVLLVLLLCGCGAQTAPSEKQPESAATAENHTDITDETIREITEFINIFVEQRFEEYNGAATGSEPVLAFLHGVIRDHDPGSCENKPLGAGGTMYETISLAAMNQCAASLFDLSFSEDEVKDYIVTRFDGDVIDAMYYKGEFYFAVSTEGKQNRSAAVNNISGNTDGSFQVEFTVYPGTEANTNTAACGNGSAVVRPVPREIGSTFVMVSFQANYNY